MQEKSEWDNDMLHESESDTRFVIYAVTFLLDRRRKCNIEKRNLDGVRTMKIFT